MALKIKLLIFFSLILVLCSYSAVAQCQENWDCTDWGSCSSSISSRSCYDLNSCGTINEMPAETALCSNVLPYCYDKIINQDESDVDCGGTICDACGLGQACFRDNDCAFGSCINQVCAYEQQAGKPAPIAMPSLSNFLLGATAIILVAAIIIVLIMKTGVFRMLRNASISDIMLIKKLKRRKILIISDKKEVKEEIKQIISVKKMTKKSKSAKFFENFNGYLKSIKPNLKTPKPSAIKENRAKDLLNENNSNINEHAARKFMLSNLKEVYKDG
jgi:hypothetical protein